MKKPMKLNLGTWGDIQLVAHEPLMLEGSLYVPRRLADQCDEGLLFATTTADDQHGGGVTDVRLQPFSNDQRREKQYELDWLANPVKCNPTTGKTTIYLGRYSVMDTDAFQVKGADVFTTDLSPCVPPPLDWRTTLNAEEMLDLAVAAGVDECKLRLAGIACVQLVSHLFETLPTAKAAFEIVQAWCQGKATTGEMQAAIAKNNEETHKIGADQSFNHLAVLYACMAVSAQPKDVVENVVEAAATHELNPQTGTSSEEQDAIRHATRIICANLIRGVITLEDYPELVKVIEARNQALCRMPCLDLATLATLFAPRPNPVATTSLPPPKPLELAEVEPAGRG